MLLAPEGGNVGIGMSGIGIQAPTQKLQVAGNIVATGFVCGDNLSCSSSRRLKTNVKPMEGALQKVEQLRGVRFDWKDSGKHDIGMIAEEVQEVIPEVVTYEANGEIRGLDYARLTAVLIEAVKEQQRQSREAGRQKDAQIQALKEELAQLRAETRQLQAETAAFNTRSREDSQVASAGQH